MIGDKHFISNASSSSLTKSAALEYGGQGIRVVGIAPGPIDTPMQKEWDEETKKGIAAWVPLGRIGQPEDIANCALFLASDESSYITGQEIVVDGGVMVKGG